MYSFVRKISFLFNNLILYSYFGLLLLYFIRQSLFSPYIILQPRGKLAALYWNRKKLHAIIQKIKFSNPFGRIEGR